MKLTSKAGFGIAEALIGLVIATLGIFAVSQLLANSQKAQKAVSTSSEFNNAASIIQMLITGDSTVCGNALRQADGVTPLVFNPPAATPGAITPTIVVPRLTLNQNDLLNSAKPINGWQVSMAFTSLINATTSPSFMVNLHLQMTAPNPTQQMGGSVKQQDFAMYVTTDNSLANGFGNIIACGRMQAQALLAPPGWPDYIRCTGTAYGAPWYGYLIFNTDENNGYWYYLAADSDGGGADDRIAFNKTTKKISYVGTTIATVVSGLSCALGTPISSIPGVNMNGGAAP